MRNPLIVFALLLLLSACYESTDQTTFILVRHAEKVADGSSDPLLTEEGEQRAERLKMMLAEQDIAAIYATPYKRNQRTVQPLADSKGIEVMTYEPHDEDFPGSVLNSQMGNTVVVCGHSNTVPGMVNALIGKQAYEQLDESDYNDLFIVTVTEMGKGTVTVINY